MYNNGILYNDRNYSHYDTSFNDAHSWQPFAFLLVIFVINEDGCFGKFK